MTSLAPVFRVLEKVSASSPRQDGVEVEFFDSWSPTVSHAYQLLPGHGDWLPEELLARLVADQRTHRKTVAVLWRKGAIWALVPLRLTGEAWQPLIRGVADPYADFLCTGQSGEVLAALRLNLTVWNAETSPAGWRNLRWLTREPSYELLLDEPPERYWRKTDRWKSVVQAQRRTADFELVRDDQSSAAWILERWHEFWFRGDTARLAAKWQDQQAFVDWGLEAGTIRTWALRDGGRWIAGAITVVKDRRLTLLTVYRDRDYDWHSVGTRVFAEASNWAYEQGLERVIFGGGFAYKRWWGKPVGMRHTYGVSPFAVHSLNWITDRFGTIRKRFGR